MLFFAEVCKLAHTETEVFTGKVSKLVTTKTARIAQSATTSINQHVELIPLTWMRVTVWKRQLFGSFRSCTRSTRSMCSAKAESST